MTRLTVLAILLAACGDNIVPKGDGGNEVCEPNKTFCSGDDLVMCDATGNEVSRTPCELGCNAMADRCVRIVPTNLADNTCGTAGTSDLVVAANMTTTINTDADCDTIRPQAGGAPSICVRKFANVNIAATGTLTATGANALAIVATSSLTIDGIVDVSSTDTASGPGAVMDGKGSQPTQASAGGGGGGYLTPGGAGAISSLITGQQGGAAGAMTGTAEISPARGGTTGGAGGPQAQQLTGAAAGFAGGALQLASCGTLSIGMMAILDAGGGGGGGGNGSLQANVDPGGGGGGGTGGSILIEAAAVTIAGGVFANGGAGGSGGAHGLAGTPGVDGNRGADGTRSTSPAAGGAGVIVGTIVTGAGGSGGALDMAPTAGGQPTAAAVESSGGGGGAAGRVRINVKASTMPTLTGAQISPEQTVGAVATN